MEQLGLRHRVEAECDVRAIDEPDRRHRLADEEGAVDAVEGVRGQVAEALEGPAVPRGERVDRELSHQLPHAGDFGFVIGLRAASGDHEAGTAREEAPQVRLGGAQVLKALGHAGHHHVVGLDPVGELEVVLAPARQAREVRRHAPDVDQLGPLGQRGAQRGQRAQVHEGVSDVRGPAAAVEDHPHATSSASRLIGSCVQVWCSRQRPPQPAGGSRPVPKKSPPSTSSGAALRSNSSVSPPESSFSSRL